MPAPGPLPTEIKITTWPERSRLGLPFAIGGTVTTDSGAAVDGVDVEVFVNKEKENGGILVGSGVARQGLFALSLDLPARFVNGSYQLIAHAIANSQYVESWSDPEISIFSGTEIVFSGPTQLSILETAKYRGRLSRETGGIVADQEITVTVDGDLQDPVTTDEQGEFIIEMEFDTPGTHVVNVELEEGNYLLGNTVELDVSVTMPSRLELNNPPGVRAGDQVSFTGRLRDYHGEPFQGQTVTLTLDGQPPRSAVTGPEGEFEVEQVVDEPGVHGFEASFAGEGFIEPASRRSSLQATEPVYLDVNGERVTQVGALYRLEGSLTGADEAPLPSMALTVAVAGRPESQAVTDAEGRFAWETVFDRPEQPTLVVGFAGTDELEPSESRWPITVDVPEIVVETTEPVARGETLTLRGVVVLADRFVPGVDVTVNDEFTVLTNGAGAFVLRYPVSPDAALGVMKLRLAAAELSTDATLEATVMSNSSIVAVPLEKVRPGRELPMELRLLNDRGEGIPGASVSYSPGMSVTTGADGVATWMITTPEEEGISVIPLTFRFEGDESNLKATQSVALPVAPAGYFWLLWIAVPIAILLTGAGAYAGGRHGLTFPGGLAGRRSDRPSAAPPAYDCPGPP